MPNASDSGQSIPCIKCKYDLRATPLLANCPECGKPAAHSKFGYRVDGEFLVIRYGTRVPLRCALTNQKLVVPDFIGAPPIASDVERGNKLRLPFGITRRRHGLLFLLYCGGYVGLMASLDWVFGHTQWIAAGGLYIALLVLGLVIGLTTYLTMAWFQGSFRPRSHYLYLVHRLAIRRTLRLTLSHLGGMLALFLPILAWCVANDRLDLLASSLGPLCFLAMPVVAALTERFPIVRIVDGENWIAGCCPEYLAFCRDERERLLAEGPSPATSTVPSGGDDCPSA